METYQKLDITIANLNKISSCWWELHSGEDFKRIQVLKDEDPFISSDIQSVLESMNAILYNNIESQYLILQEINKLMVDINNRLFKTEQFLEVWAFNLRYDVTIITHGIYDEDIWNLFLESELLYKLFGTKNSFKINHHNTIPFLKDILDILLDKNHSFYYENQFSGEIENVKIITL